MTSLDILRGARERLADPARWLHRADEYAVDANGRCVHARSPLAARWDIAGAMMACGVSAGAKVFRQALAVLAGAIGAEPYTSDLAEWNDAFERTHAEVLAALDKAIRLADEAHRS